MDLREYQIRSSQFAIYPDCGSNPIYPTLGLCGESGEVAEKVKKVIRDKEGQFDNAAITAITLELGDVLWYVAQLANELDIDLGDVAANNLDKLANRQHRGVVSGSGDDR
jgi:NTP pyrophosphatase (non-canonical NTP hydrolase)